MSESLEQRALRIWRQMRLEAGISEPHRFLEGTITEFARRLMAEQEPVAWGIINDQTGTVWASMTEPKIINPGYTAVRLYAKGP